MINKLNEGLAVFGFFLYGKRIKDNIYCVLGVLIKKADNDMEGYKTITSRETPDVSTDKLLEIQLQILNVMYL